ncbi:MAG: M42 family metallopeptidase [Bacillota bacterium]
MLELLQKMTSGFGPAGQENFIRDIIKDEIKDHVDEMRVDKLGNLIAYKKGNGTGKKIMLAAHMDEIGIMITHIDDEGFLRFTTVGGVNPKNLVNRNFVFNDMLVGTVGVEKLDSYNDLKLDKLFLDIGAKNREEAKKQVSIGDVAVYQRNFNHNIDRVITNSLDDRAGCTVLISMLQELEQSEHDIYAVFTVQEEVGTKGAGPAAFGIEPDFALALDVTATGDTPEAHTMDVKLGEGAAIKVMDRGSIAHPGIKRLLADLAEKNNIAYQYEVLEFGATDARSIQLSRGGVPSGTISIPTRYIHSPAEMLDLKDLESCRDLVLQFILSDKLNNLTIEE